VNSYENVSKLCNVCQSLGTCGLKCERSLNYVIAGVWIQMLIKPWIFLYVFLSCPMRGECLWRHDPLLQASYILSDCEFKEPLWQRSRLQSGCNPRYEKSARYLKLGTISVTKIFDNSFSTEQTTWENCKWETGKDVDESTHSLKSTVFWSVTLCRPVEVHKQSALLAISFWLVSCLAYPLILKMEAVHFSAASVNVYWTTQLYILEK
jgi:hypothetical protein